MNNDIKEKIKAYYIEKDIDEILDYITNLQEENKELNRMCEIYSKSLYNADLTKAEIKIDKAIEILKSTMYPDIARQKALNILQGSDKE